MSKSLSPYPQGQQTKCKEWTTAAPGSRKMFDHFRLRMKLFTCLYWNDRAGADNQLEQSDRWGSSSLCCVATLAGRAFGESLLVLLYIYLDGEKKCGWGSESNLSTAGERRGPERVGLLQRRNRWGDCGDGQIWECSGTKINVLSYLRWLSKQYIVSHIHQVLGWL